MKNVNQVENVITVDFAAAANAIAHPASKNFPIEDEDPLAQLLADYDLDEEEEEELVQEPVFSHVSFNNSMMTLCSELQTRVAHLKKTSQRLKYYLDESYID